MCKRCLKHYKKYPLIEGEHVYETKPIRFTQSPIGCAFDEEGIYRAPNYSCQTMGLLRELSGEDWEEKNHVAFHHRDDMRSASIGVVHIPEADNEDIQQGYLVMTWYKSRGATGQAYVMWDDNEPEKLTEKTAEFIIKSLRNNNKL